MSDRQRVGYPRALPFVLSQDDQVGIASAIADTIDNVTIRFEPPRIWQSLGYLLMKGPQYAALRLKIEARLVCLR
jgi:predicted component of type VI protein secretion system